MTAQASTPVVENAPVVNDGKRFDELLGKFVKHTKANMSMALELSHIAFTQFRDHGNLDCALRFLNAMPQNYLRKRAFALWMVQHSPCKIAQAKLVKDHERNQDFDTDGAFKKPFWEFAPEAPIITYSASDIKSALERALNPFSSSDRKVALDEYAVRQLALAQKMVADLPLIDSEPELKQAA